MKTYDLIDEAVIDATPDAVWAALVAELGGAARWWVPFNTFEPGALPPDQVGGKVKVTVHVKGVDNGGPKLRFTARTRGVEPGRRLTSDYVAGVFRGRSDFLLEPLDGGRRTRLSMHFVGQPSGWLRHLAKVKDLGVQHSQATQAAFANLAALLAAEAEAARASTPRRRSTAASGARSRR
jgi:uncharacterized protein YndB with AHSA1/START domain